jgi:phosphoserine phosphatase
MFIATLIAEGIGEGQVAAAQDALAAAGCLPDAPAWLDRGAAADLPFARHPEAAKAALAGAPFDWVVQPAAGREKRLLVADMDSTMITVECIDELADYAGIKPQVAAVTEAAMRGELDFAGALAARVTLLAGLDQAVIARCLAERVRLSPGARTLVRTMRARGAEAVLVSGGFTAFAEPVGAEIGFSRIVANRLDVAEGRLTGRVMPPIVDAATKERELRAAAAALGLPLAETLAVGDGANDLPMMRAAGLGVAYRAKPKVAAEADMRVERGDLTALLYAQGIVRRDWAV